MSYAKEEENEKALQNDNNNREKGTKYKDEESFLNATTRNNNLYHPRFHYPLSSRIYMKIRMGDVDKKEGKLLCSYCISTGLLLFP